MNETKVEMSEQQPRRSSSSSLVIGAILVLLGIVFLLGQIFSVTLDIDLGDYGWPFFVIIPGVVLLLFGLGMRSGEGLAVFGGIVTTVGLILFVQNATDLWATWAYAWALVAPTSIGLAMILWGALHGRGDIVRKGLNTAAVGLGIFLVGAFFFELIIGLSGFRTLGGIAWPILLIGLGVILLLGNFMRRRA